jgi:hypothetical protein
MHTRSLTPHAPHLFSALTLALLLWPAASAQVQDQAEYGDNFGRAVAVGDFNGDGDDDLAVGVPGEAVGDLDGAGAVNVIYGEPGGLGTAVRTAQLWHQDVAGVMGVAAAHEQFGFALAVGDFNDSDNFRRDDLAIGTPFEAVSGQPDAGSVTVLYSSDTGLTDTDQVWTQNSFGVTDAAEPDDGFGYALAVGRFDQVYVDALVIGVPYEDLGSLPNAGAVHVLYGSPLFGLVEADDDFLHQNIAGAPGVAEAGDEFGFALAAANFEFYFSDSYDDLAVGSHFEAVGNTTAAGAVNVFLGSYAGLDQYEGQLWHQDVSGVLDAAETDDGFGFALAVGDFNDDRYFERNDLAIGVLGESVGGAGYAGAVHVLYGVFEQGLTATGDQLWHQDSAAPLAGGDPEAATEAAPVASAGTGAADAFVLLPAAPNPFRGSTTLRFTLGEAGRVRLTVYDVLGREVAVPLDEAREAGTHAVAFDAGALSSGTYLVRIEAVGQVLTQQLTLLR